MEPSAPIIVIDNGNGGHCWLWRQLIAAAAMAVFEPTVQHQLLPLTAATKIPLLPQPSTAAADIDDHHRRPQ